MFVMGTLCSPVFSSVFQIFSSYGKARSQLFDESYGTYHLMGFCTLAPGETCFQLYRHMIGIVDVDITQGKAPKNL